MKHKVRFKTMEKVLKIVVFTLVLGIFNSCVRQDKSQSELRKNPNIILINADDLGYGDLSCYGASKVQTPEYR